MAKPELKAIQGGAAPARASGRRTPTSADAAVSAVENADQKETKVQDNKIKNVTT